MPSDVGLDAAPLEQSAPASARLPLGVGLLVSGAASAGLWAGIVWLLRGVF